MSVQASEFGNKCSVPFSPEPRTAKAAIVGRTGAKLFGVRPPLGALAAAFANAQTPEKRQQAAALHMAR